MKNLRPEVQQCLKSVRPGMHGITDLFDDLFLGYYNVTDDELDYILDRATNEEIQLISDALGDDEGPAAFSLRRKALVLRNYYLNEYRNLE
jgi:hypothetical protein